MGSSGNELLDAIMNKRLRKAPERKADEQRDRSNTASGGNTVAALLARRIHIEMSDSEGSMSEEEWSSDGGWSD